jgi:hypothetical protein
MKIVYQYFDEGSFLIQKFSGVWSFDRYEQYVVMGRERLEISKIRKILTDLREVSYSLQKGMLNRDLSRMLSIRNMLPERNFLNIHLVTSPILTIISDRYQANYAADLQTHYGYCSTIEYARHYLNLPYKESELKEMIENLTVEF